MLQEALRPGIKTVALLRNGSAALVLPIMRTREIKDQIVEAEQERRKRVHKSIDQIEDSTDDVAW